MISLLPLFIGLILIFFISSKLFLSSYIKNPVKYMYLQVKCFIGKLIVSSILVFLFCTYYEELKMIIIIASLVIFTFVPFRMSEI